MSIRESSVVNRRPWPSGKEGEARLLQTQWDEKWSSASPARWADRPAPLEVIEAVSSGWLPSCGRMVDLGCGTAEIAAWFAERGYQATGVDIAQAAVDRAAAKHGHLSASIEFIAANLCTQTLSDRTFEILVDRGCFHQIPHNLRADYVRNISSLGAPGAKMLLFMKAFRQGRQFGDAEEVRLRVDWVRHTFAAHFDLERAAPTYLNPDDPTDPLPGMVFWLSRKA